MKNRKLEIHHRDWNLTYEFTGWRYSIAGTWEFNDWDEISEHAFIKIDVEISEKWDIETEDILHQFSLGIRFLEDVRLEMQEAINSDLQHFEFWEWKLNNDECNYTFYHEL